MAEDPVVVKTEHVEAIDIESRILELCGKNPVGISDDLLQAAIPTSSVSQRVVALNRLISQGKLEILKQGKELLYRLKDPTSVNKCRGADNEEKLVYQIVEKAKNKGIWTRDIRFQSNLSLTHVNKILKNLESKKLIKSVKPVNASKKKIYMLYDLEPDCTVTGGAWYSDQEFESEFVDVLNQQCYRYLLQARPSKDRVTDPIAQRNASFKSSEEIWKYINELKISKVQLSVQDIEAILNTLIYDGKVEKSVINVGASGMNNLYRAIDPLVPSVALMRIPCGLCPLLDDCREGSVISPSTCEYMKDWLEENL